MLNSVVFLEGILSLVNVVSLFVIVYFLEENLRMNWILKDELNAFSVLLFISLGGLLLREILFLWTMIGSYFVGMEESYIVMSSTTPWLIINSLFSLALVGTAYLTFKKDSKILVIYKSGRIWFKIVDKK